MVFMEYRLYLPGDHPYRKQKKVFNGEQVFEKRPKILIGEQVFEKVKDIQITFGKKKEHKDAIPSKGYKKCSVL